ncbi:hypothetical protein T439DRAFT_299633 [Meredithblackwellia eburnea MCA 4105]
MSDSRSQSPSTSGSSTPKGNYVRPTHVNGNGGMAKSMLSKALHNASSMNTPGSSKGASTTKTPSSNDRAQFEGQEDFIGFGDMSDEEETQPTPRQGGRGSASKRKYEETSERQEEGTRRLAKRERERSTPWCEKPGVDWDRCDNATALLNAEARAFITYISPTPIEHELRLWTVELIRRTIKSRWSDADVECFGSVGTGLYLPGGDIDLVVLCPSFPSPPLKPTSSLLHRLASILLASSIAEPSSLLVIAKARVPIVKFTTRYGGFSVDLSVNQKNGVDAAMRVRDMLELHAWRDEGYVEPGSKASSKGKGKAVDQTTDDEHPVDHGVARSLVMLVKAFLNQRGMNEVFTGGLGSYSIICLVISFLQLHPKIQTGQIHPARNVGLLFVEFLEYYGKHFNYTEAGITLRAKGGYFNKHDKGWFRQQQPYLLSIEDPNDPTNDVSGGSHNIIRVRQTLAGAFDVLTATLLHRASHFEAARDPTCELINGDVLPNADADATSPLRQSILGAVIGMSREGIESREENVSLHEAEILQDLIEQTGGVDSLSGMSKKAMKKSLKELRDVNKRAKTVARLERRKVERQEKIAKRQRDKESQKNSLDDARRPSDSGPEDDALASQKVAKKLFADADDSRYSIASPGPQSQPATSTNDFLYINDSEEEDDSEDSDSHDDGDVVVGGSHGGDTLVGTPPKKKRRVEEDGNSASDSGDDDLVVQGLLGNQSTAQTSEEEKELRKAKAAARTAFWSAKGPKETITLDSD